MSTSEKALFSPVPEFFVAGIDLGQKQEHSAVAVVDKRDKEFYLFLPKQFELGTEYGSVLPYLKLLKKNLHDLRRIMIDQTGVGKTFMSMAISSELKNARGIVLSQPKKQNVLTFLKHYGRWTRPHTLRPGVHERAECRMLRTRSAGRLKFSHPPGTHDDRLWAFALAVCYARLEPTEYHSVAAVNKYPRPGNLFPQLPRSLWKT